MLILYELSKTLSRSDFLDQLLYTDAYYSGFQKLPLRPDGEVTAAWLNPPIKPLLRVYLFNVTNPAGFLDGEKPKLQEVGPFVYE